MDRNRIREVFADAAVLPPDERRAFVETACAGDPDAFVEVMSLLRASDRLGPETKSSFSGRPASRDESVGSEIGAYKLLEIIGEGGFGVVFLAEQSVPLRRKVAVKILKPGLDTRQIIARFEAERQALAMMDHVNIARVFDAGTTPAGRPYFVMELVRGLPVTTYCDENRLGARERLDVFLQVCQGVNHAHQKGIIHRDLKPGNVLVTLHDGVAVPKIIDFGIAKATHAQLINQTLFTGVHQIVGTPAYMSPEQAELSGHDIDTRSDVYSLGVLLYELMTGATPFDSKSLHAAGIAEMQRIIREVDPPKPSIRVSRLGELTQTMAERRRIEPEKLGRLLRGELDWIIMKSLEKDRRRRYDSAAAFANDVERCIRNEPVVAGPPSAIYRARKFVSRNRAGVSAAALIVAALVAGFAVSTVGFIRASRERDAKEAALLDVERQRIVAQDAQRAEAAQRGLAEDRAAQAKSLLSFSDQMIGSADPDVTRTIDITAVDVLDRAAAQISTYFPGQPAAEMAMRSRIGRAYISFGEFRKAAAQLDAAVTLMRTLPDVPLTDRQSLLNWYSYALFMKPDVTYDLPAIEAGALAKQILIEQRPDVGEAMVKLENTFGYRSGRLDREVCDPAFGEAVDAIRTKMPIDDPLRETAISFLFVIASATGEFFTGNSTKAQLIAAATYESQILSLALESMSESHARVILIRVFTLYSYLNAGDVENTRRVAEEWSKSLQRSRPADHWLVQFAEGMRGLAIGIQGKLDEGIAILEPAVEIVDAQRGSSNVAGYELMVGLLRLKELKYGKRVEEDALRNRVAAAAAAGGTAGVPAGVMRMVMRTDQAEFTDIAVALFTDLADPSKLTTDHLDAYLAAKEKFIAKDPARAYMLARMTTRAIYDSGLRDFDPQILLRIENDAIPRLRTTCDIDENGLGWALAWQATLLARTGDLPAAEKAAREAVVVFRSNRGAAKNILAWSLMRQGRWQEADAVAAQAFRDSVERWGFDRAGTRDSLDILFEIRSHLKTLDTLGPILAEMLAFDDKSPIFERFGGAQRAAMLAELPNATSFDLERALRVARRFPTTQSSDWKTLYAIGLLQYRRGEFDSAFQALEKARSLAQEEQPDGQPAVLAMQAQVRAAQGLGGDANTLLNAAEKAAESGIFKEDEWTRSRVRAARNVLGATSKPTAKAG